MPPGRMVVEGEGCTASMYTRCQAVSVPPYLHRVQPSRLAATAGACTGWHLRMPHCGGRLHAKVHLIHASRLRLYARPFGGAGCTRYKEQGTSYLRSTLAVPGSSPPTASGGLLLSTSPPTTMNHDPNITREHHGAHTRDLILSLMCAHTDIDAGRDEVFTDVYLDSCRLDRPKPVQTVLPRLLPLYLVSKAHIRAMTIDTQPRCFHHPSRAGVSKL